MISWKEEFIDFGTRYEVCIIAKSKYKRCVHLPVKMKNTKPSDADISLAKSRLMKWADEYLK